MSVRLFVGNLAYGVTEAEVRELFSAVGAVSQVRMPIDRETGKPRRFAFVDFSDRSQAEEAIRRFNQYVFKESAIEVNEARARESEPSGAPSNPRPPARPRPSPASQPVWAGPSDSDDDTETLVKPRRTYGPDASAKDKRKQKGRTSREERGPIGPLRERGGGQSIRGVGFEDDEDDEGLDDFALWAREDAKNQDEE